MRKHTLLLRLSGPMQSWGSRSRFRERDTEREPTKSGVLGLVCAALGRDRAADVSDLVALRMGTRVDREGIIERDFQTALNVRRADPKTSPNTVTVPSSRYYLADAAFLVGLEGEDLVLLESIDAALQRPRWHLYLGRKAFVPGEPVRLPDGLRRDQDLESALRSYPRLAQPFRPKRSEALAPVRLVIECSAGEEGELRPDVPISFLPDERRYGTRAVRTEFVPLLPNPPAGENRCS